MAMRWMKTTRAGSVNGEKVTKGLQRPIVYLVTSSRCSGAAIESRATRTARLSPSDWRPGRDAPPAPPHAGRFRSAVGTRPTRRHSPTRRCSCCCYHHGLQLHRQARRSFSPQIKQASVPHRESIDVFGEKSRAKGSREGWARTARRGGLILRAASRICLAVFLRAPAALHLQRCIKLWCRRRHPPRASLRRLC